MITILLEQIIQLLKGWIESFNNHAEAVEDSLTDLNNTASDIETNTDPIPEIRDNTGAIITPITQIKTNTDSIKTDVTQIKTDTTIIKNNANSISTSAGAAAAFAEDCATNTLDIKDKITTIASDTTQLRADSANIAADVSSINQALGYYIANTPVTENIEGEICNFDSDLEDYLQKLKVNIPSDLSGFSGISLTKCGKNLSNTNSLTSGVYWGSSITAFVNLLNTLPSGKYTVSVKYKVDTLPGNNKVQYSNPVIRANINGNIVNLSIYTSIVDSDPSVGKIYNTTCTIEITPEAVGNITNFYIYCDQADTHSGTNRGDYTPFDIQIEIGESQTTFEEYKSMIYPVSFGSTITDGAEVDLLSGIVKINTTPVTYSSITPIAIRTYKGVNNIYSDVGSMSLTYRETLKHYLDKQQ